MWIAARRPSSVRVGGIWMSTTATSGLWAPTLRRRSTASPAWPTTSKPASSSRRAMPSRKRAWSSPITIRTCGASRSERYSSGGGLPQRVHRRARQGLLRDEAERAGAPQERGDLLVRVRRGEDDPRRRLLPGQRRGNREAVHIGKVHVEQHRVGMERARCAQRRCAVARFADDRVAAILEQRPRELPESRMIVDHEHRPNHLDDAPNRRRAAQCGYPEIRRYFATARGAKTAISASDQATAPQMLSPAGAPSHSARIASTTTVIGLTSANWRSPSGIDSTGTNAAEMNVIGKISVKPTPLAASGDETDIPSSAKIHENAKPNSNSSPTPPRISGALASNEKPMTSPVPSRTAIESAFVATSASVRPASTEARAVGSERKRSIRPFVRSSARPSAVTKPPNAMFWTMIPGIRKSM